LLDIAGNQFGYFTTAQAVAAGINDANVRQMAARGALKKVFRGVYRIDDFPHSEHDQYMEACLWANGKGFIIDKSALVLWNLCDVNPRKIYLGIPRNHRITKNVPHLFEVKKVAHGFNEIDEVKGIPVLAPYLTIKRCINNNMRSDLLTQAINNAYKFDYLDKKQEARLIVQLDERDRP